MSTRIRIEQPARAQDAPPGRRPPHTTRVTGARVGRLLADWQAQELARALRFKACRGLDQDQLWDLYQDTALVLWSRSFQDEQHLRNALRHGLVCRALAAYRDQRRREEILANAEPGIQALATAGREELTGEPLLLAQEDRRIASEFMTELTDRERSVYWLMSVEDRGHASIARALDIPDNQVRAAIRSCERKRDRFQTLFDAGRLCGYRAQTIQALQDGETTSSDLALQALAHIQSCPHCNRTHGKLARRLRRTLGEQLAVLLPIPVLSHYPRWPATLALHARSIHQHLTARAAAIQASTTERTVIVLTTGAGKTTGRLATSAGLLAALAGTLSATHLITSHHTTSHHHPSTPTTPRYTALPKPSELALLHPTLHTPDLRRPAHVARPQAGLPFGPGYALPASHTSSHTHKHLIHPPAPRAQATVLHLWRPARATPPRREPQQTKIPGGGGEFSP